MNNVSETILKVASIFLIAHGMTSFVELYASLKSMPQEGELEIPVLLYYSQLIPMLIGITIWLTIPQLLKTQKSSGETLTSRTTVSTGCFLIGIYFLGNYLPEFVSAYIQYLEVAKIQYVGEAFASTQTTNLIIMGAKCGIGLLLTIFSVRLGALYMVIGRLGVDPSLTRPSN